MHTEIRKLHLIEEVLKVDDEQTLNALEAILKGNGALEKSSRNPFSALSGIWSEAGALQIENNFIENCEQINQNDWK